MMAGGSGIFLAWSVILVDQSQPFSQISVVFPSQIVCIFSGSASVVFSRKCSLRQSLPNCAHKVPLKLITIREPLQLLSPSPLPNDEDDPLHAIELDDGDPDPKQGVSGHIPLDDVDRFELFLSSKLTITEMFVGIFSVFLSYWLPGCSCADDVDDDDDVPGSPWCSWQSRSRWCTPPGLALCSCSASGRRRRQCWWCPCPG